MRYNLHLIILCFATKYSIFFVTGGQFFVSQGQPVRAAWKDSDTQSPNFEGWCPSKFFKEDTTAKRLTMLSSRSSSPLRCGRQWIYHGRGSPCLSSFQLPSTGFQLLLWTVRTPSPSASPHLPARASARPLILLVISVFNVLKLVAKLLISISLSILNRS